MLLTLISLCLSIPSGILVKQTLFSRASTPLIITQNAPISHGIQVVGNTIFYNGQPFIMHGASMLAMRYSQDCYMGKNGKIAETQMAQYHLLNTDEISILHTKWGMNTFRFQVPETALNDTSPAISDPAYEDSQGNMILPKPGETERDFYLDRVKRDIAVVEASNSIAILTMHSDPICDSKNTKTYEGEVDKYAGEPTQATYDAWEILAPVFANDPHVIYELYNEPTIGFNPKHYGNVPVSRVKLRTWSKDEQNLVNAIRKTSKNMLLADGPAYGETLADINSIDPITGNNYLLHDVSGNGIAYAIHPYEFGEYVSLNSSNNNIVSTKAWDFAYGKFSNYYPVVATEWYAKEGICGNSGEVKVPLYLSYLDQHLIGLTFFAGDSIVSNETIEEPIDYHFSTPWVYQPTFCHDQASQARRLIAPNAVITPSHGGGGLDALTWYTNWEQKQSNSLTLHISAADQITSVGLFMLSLSQMNPLPSGTITLFDNNVPFVKTTLSKNGTIAIPPQTLYTGTHKIIAIYSGDTHYLPSASQSFTIISNFSPPNPTDTPTPSPSIITPTDTTAPTTPITPTPTTPIINNPLNLIINGSFEAGTILPWRLYTQDNSKGDVSLDTSTAIDGSSSLKVDITQLGNKDYDLQIAQDNIHISAHKTYVLSFYAKSSNNRFPRLFMQNTNHDPYATDKISLTNNWQKYTFTFSQNVTDIESLKFNFAKSLGSVWIDDVSLIQQ